MPEFKIGDRYIGDQYPPFIIAVRHSYTHSTTPTQITIFHLPPKIPPGNKIQ